MKTLRSGNRVSARSAAASRPARNGVAPAMWVVRSASISDTAVSAIPALHQHRRGAQQQRAFERIDRSADMRDRRRDQKPVAIGDQPVLADLADQGMDRIMSVKNAFRPSRGAGRIEDHSHAVRIQHRQGGRGRFGQEVCVRRVIGGVTAQHDDLRRRGHLRGDPLQHGGVVVAAERERGEDHPSIGIGQDEFQLTITQRRQDRVHHHACQRRPKVDHGRLVPVQQHERHHAARGHPRHQALRQDCRLPMQGRAVETNVTVHHHRSLRRGSGGIPKRVGERLGHPQSTPVGVGCALLVDLHCRPTP